MSGWTNGICAFALLWAAQAQPPRFTIQTDAVRLDVSVVHRGRPVPGLGVADFRVVDNGVVQHVEQVFTDQEPIDAWLLLDRSQSSAGDVWPHLRQAAVTFADALGADDRVGVLTFGSTLTLAASPDADRTRVREVLGTMSPAGNTRLFDAIHTAAILVLSSSRRSALVTFTDGRDNASWVSLPDVQAVLARAETVLYSVTVLTEVASHSTPMAQNNWDAAARRPATKILEQLTTDTGGQTYTVRSAASLRETYATIARGLKTRYVVTYIPRGVASPGWHQVQVTRIGGPGRVHSRKQYWSDERRTP